MTRPESQYTLIWSTAVNILFLPTYYVQQGVRSKGNAGISFSCYCERGLWLKRTKPGVLTHLGDAMPHCPGVQALVGRLVIDVHAVAVGRGRHYQHLQHVFLHFADLACRHQKRQRPYRPLGRKAKGCHIWKHRFASRQQCMRRASLIRSGSSYRHNPHDTHFIMQSCCLSAFCDARLACVHEAAVGAQPAHRRGKQLRAPELAVAHHVVRKRVRHHARCAHNPHKVCTGDPCQQNRAERVCGGCDSMPSDTSACG